MQVKVYECGHTDGKEDRDYVGTFTLESILENNADAFSAEEFDGMKKSLAETGKAALPGYTGVWHEYEAVEEPTDAPSI